MKLDTYNQKGEKTGTIELAQKVFGLKMNYDLVHQAMVAQMGNERQIIAHTKTRSEVRGGGRKPWKQKGTGRARVGSRRSPIWIGGGVTFGPNKDRNFSKNLNKKMKQKATAIVLSDKVNNNGLVVMEELKMEEYKTKNFNEILKNTVDSKKQNEDKEDTKKKKVDTRRSVLVVNDTKDEKVKYSGRNLVGVKVINLENINILDLLKYKNLILTKDGVKNLENKYIKKVKKKSEKK